MMVRGRHALLVTSVPHLYLQLNRQLRLIVEYIREAIWRLEFCPNVYQLWSVRRFPSGLLQVLTKDSVTVSVDAVVYYRVSNATVSVANVENAHHSTRLLAQTTLRNILGTKNLHEILSDRESISGSMQTVLDEATAGWGIKVERVEM